MLKNIDIKFIICVLIVFIFATINSKIIYSMQFIYDYSGEDYTFNLPHEYSSVENALVTSVKSQLYNGACWSFGIISTLESSYLKQYGLKIKNDWEPDYSEMNLIYNLNKDCSFNNPYEFDYYENGDNTMASAYFASGRGPVLEKNDTYTTELKKRNYIDNKKINNDKYVREIIYIPDPAIIDEMNLRNHREIIKKFIYENASVTSNIYFDEQFFDESGNSYFYNSYQTSSNHTIAIVGWDDNYSKENFKNYIYNRSLPQNDGAFLVKNSWGPNKHKSGYFYISYEDKFCGYESYTLKNIVDNNGKYLFDKIYQHDFFGMTDYFDSNILDDNNLLCTIFDLRSKQETLTDIGIFIACNNVKCKFFLAKVEYDSLNNENKIVAYSDYIYTRDFKFPGYYTVEIPKKILLDEEKFGIGIEMSCDNLFIPCEKKIYGYCSKVNTNNAYNFCGNCNDFMLLNEKIHKDVNLCIKAFTELDVNNSNYEKINYNKLIDSKESNENEIKTNIQSENSNKKTNKTFDNFVPLVISLILFGIFVNVVLHLYYDKYK